MKITVSFEVDSKQLGWLESVLGGKGIKANKHVSADDLDEESADDLDEESEEGVTLDMIREKIVELTKKKKKDKIELILSKFKVAKTSALKPAQYEKFFEYLNKIK